MTTVRAFTCFDLFRYSSTQLDKLTETYNLPFYLPYMSSWPELFWAAESPQGNIMGYMMGKVPNSHFHLLPNLVCKGCTLPTTTILRDLSFVG
jgi:hypothetical protein